MLPLRLALLGSLVFASFACDGEAQERIAELEAELEAAKQAEAKATLDCSTAAAAEAKLQATAKAELAELEAETAEQVAKITALENAKGNLESTLEQKQAAIDAIKALEDTLAKSMVEEIETGDIRVSRRDGLLVIDVSDTVLFAIGEAELSERGQKVLTRLADSLLALRDEAIFQVGGHTDNQAIKSEEVKARFATNWELSAARATNVVRFLEETCKVPGKRLIAAGFSEFRAIASNKKPAGRAKNRRIEIALLPSRG